MRAYYLILVASILLLGSCAGFPAAKGSETEDSVTIASLPGGSRSPGEDLLPQVDSVQNPGTLNNPATLNNPEQSDIEERFALPPLPEPVGMDEAAAILSKAIPGAEKSSPGARAAFFDLPFDLPEIPEPSRSAGSGEIPLQKVGFSPSRSLVEDPPRFSAGIYRPVSGLTEEYEEYEEDSSGRSTPAPTPSAPNPAPEDSDEDRIEDRAEKQQPAAPDREPDIDPLEQDIDPVKPDIKTSPAPRQLQAIPGEDLAISLSGDGWYFLGDNSAASGFRFLQRIFRDGNSIFLFSIEDAGEWIIEFHRQDLENGISESRRYLISSREEHPLFPLQGDTGQGNTGGAIDGDISAADGEALAGGEAPGERRDARKRDIALLYRSGKRLEALSAVMEDLTGNELPAGMEELLGLSPPGSDDLPSSLHDASWVENFSSPKVDLDSKTETALVAFLEWLLPVISDDLRDRYYYRLAKLLETSPPPRDEKRAAAYYQEIRDHYPWSSYWQEAGERERYLRRHYLEVR
jgi:hypothetical protein